MLEAIAAGLPIIGGIIGEIASAPDREAAERLRERAMEQYNIDLPPLDDILAEALGPSAMEGATGSAEAKALRMKALRGLSERASEGFNIEDRAALNEGLGEVAAAERGSREAILRSLPANSGERTAALLSNQQASAQRGNAMGLNVLAEGRRRALAALAQSGGLAGDIDETEFGQQAARARAADSIAEFNARNRWDTARFNKGLEQDRYDNQLEMADRKAGQLSDEADAYEQRGQQKRGMWGGMGAGAQQGVLGYSRMRRGR